MKAPSLIEKTLAFLKAEPSVYGLEISDAAIRLTYLKGGEWQFKSERLEPGILEGGQVKKRKDFIDALLRLQAVLGPRKRDQKVNVVVVVSSLHIYSQIFSLPIIKGESLDKAIELNLQMVSPVESTQSYAGWQIVGEDKATQKVEILSAFINRGIADEISSALEEAGFLIVVFEPRALSLVRLVREETLGVDLARPYLIANVDDSGMDLLVVRHGELYFQYFNPWRELHEGRFMSIPLFENIVVRSFSQVLNFSAQHWPEPLTETFLFAIGLGDRVSEIIKKNFSLTIRELKLKTPQAVEPSWFIVLGAALRGLLPRHTDHELNLLGVEVQEKFRHAQLSSFVKFWRVLVPVALSILIAGFIGAELFLVNIEKDLASQVSQNQQGAQAEEFATLEAQAQSFNQSVALIQAVRTASKLKWPVLDKMLKVASANNIVITHIPFNTCGMPISFTGKTTSESQILGFKTAMEKDPGFSGVSLPLNSVVKDPQGAFSFSVTVTITCATS